MFFGNLWDPTQYTNLPYLFNRSVKYCVDSLMMVDNDRNV